MKKIMIVDDEPFMLRVISRILSAQYETLCVTSGEEALELFERENPDLVLSDLRMPNMDGYELRRRLQERSNVPFIFMTADESNESESKGLNLGAADYIRKPANAEVLIRRIGNIMQNVERIHGLKEAASEDKMTGLLNKAAAEGKIDEVCRKVPGAFLMIDLDSFKPVNDLYGHDMGDRILVCFAELIKSIIRSTDIAGRLGGDEFAAYLLHVKDEDVIRRKSAYLNEQILLFAKEYMGSGLTIPLGASVGVAFAPEDGADFATLSKKADKALYRVKNGGKHGVAFYGTRQSAPPTAKSISNMRKILAERSPEPGAFMVDFERFKCLYQFILRLGEEYRRRVQFMEFTLSVDEPREAEAAQVFGDMLKGSLRRGDCVMQNGATKFFAILTNVEEEDVKSVLSRLRAKWAQEAAADYCDFGCETENLA